MDKAVLKEYIDACEIVRETEAQLRKLKDKYETAASDVVKGSNPAFPYQEVTFKIEGVGYHQYKYPDEVEKLEAILKERRDIAKKKQLSVEAWINIIPSRMQRIVRFKYIMGLTWVETGMRMGDRDGEAVRKEFQRFMAADE